MADNPIKYSDFIKPDESVTGLIKQLEDLQSTYSEMLKKIKDDALALEITIKKVNGVTEEGQKATKKAATEADKLASAEDRLNKSREDTGKQLAKVKLAQQQQNNINKLTAKLNEAAEGSYDKLSAQYALNKVELNAMSKAQRDNTKEGQALEKQTAEIYEEMKRLQEATGKYTLNVGNYKNSILDAIKEQIRLNQQLQKTKKDFEAQPKVIKENQEAIDAYDKEVKALETSISELATTTGKSLDDIQNDIEDVDFEDMTEGSESLKDSLASLPGPAGAAAGGLQGIGAAAKKLLANPIILLIAGIVAGLAALYKLFKQTKAGSDLLAKGSAALNGIFSALVGVVNTLYEGLKAVFEDPQQAMKDFWEALKKNIVNRLTGVIDLVKALGSAFKALWERDMEGLKTAAKDAGTALVQMNTGLDEQQQKSFAQAIQETTKAIYDQADAFAQLEQARRDTRTANRELEKQLEDLITKEELLRATADNSTKSFKEREEAAKQASQLTIQRAGVEQEIAKSNLDLINREIDLRSKKGEDIEDLLDQQLDAYKTLKGAQRDYLLVTDENQKRESELKQDRLEKDLDILIDGFDNQKTINERIIADDTKTFEERKKVLDQTKGLFEDTFAKQIETIQQFTDQQINANDLINESDAVALNQKIRGLGLSEIIEGRLLEIVRERRIANQDLAEAEKDLAEKKEAADTKALEDSKKLQKQQYEAGLDALDQEYDLRLSEIDIMKTTEAEKTRLRLQAEKERLQAILDLNKKSGGDLSKVQVEAVKNTIEKINQEMATSVDEDQDIYSAVGLNLSDEAKEGISISTQYAIDAVNTFLQAKVDAANAAVEAADMEADAAQSAVDSEIEARNNGYASNVSQAQKELALAKKQQDAALKQQEKAQKAQAAIETLQQIGSLVTGAAKIWGTLGFPWAIPAIAVMFGSFAFAKIKAGQAAKKKEFADGGLEILGGGSHASGNDTVIGHNNGHELRGEKDEALAVINKHKTRKYKNILPGIIKSLNKGIFEKKYGPAYDLGGLSLSAVSNNVDIKNLENDVRDIKKQGERRYFVDGKGRVIETYKNLRRIYNAN